MPNNELLARLKKAVEAQKAVQNAAKAVKAEIERLRRRTPCHLPQEHKPVESPLSVSRGQAG